MVTDEELSAKIRKFNKILRKAAASPAGNPPGSARSAAEKADTSSGSGTDGRLSDGIKEQLLSIILSYNTQHKKISTSMLAEELGISISTACRHVKLLETEGLITLIPHKALPIPGKIQKDDDMRTYRKHNRLKWINLSISGYTYANRIRSAHKKKIDECYRNLNSEERQTLSEILDKLIDEK